MPMRRIADRQWSLRNARSRFHIHISCGPPKDCYQHTQPANYPSSDAEKYFPRGHADEAGRCLFVAQSSRWYACPDRGRCVLGFSRFPRCDRGRSRWCERSPRHGPRDILGRIGDGSHRRHRQTFWRRCLKICGGKHQSTTPKPAQTLYVRHRT